MERRRFTAAAAALLIAGCVPRVTPAADTAAVKQTVSRYYAAFSSLDRQTYRTLVTEDYRLLENGTLFDIEGDVGGMPSPALHPTRKDAFDFRLVKIQGDVAYVAYFLSSDTVDDEKGARSRRWLESAILRRSGTGWRVALLHSTPIVKPPTG